ncbi:unnamed protein product (macronuclear) [Paramecium tetraurelia]|uniref:Uncharacterized protein n=1 Tax=Paramecium tetraurelia TaxID=5888 RepID=A0EG84_PARTE|nr:uncharacterized protein GSPATT00026649001 [Paramecium tetraurelia]CAK94325.1 unnamed protein product [Paramecium tetraurelia]|eukprot:XP_001461698.1 hypothetical protein (macronuclear) [Paramecium tetraurelia strain d4-2]
MEMANKPVAPTKQLTHQQTPNASEYKIQFKVGGGKQMQKEDANQFNSQAAPFIPMSPQQRHENAQILQSPQNRQPYLLSPQHQSPQLQFQSPNTKDLKPQQFFSQMQTNQQPKQIAQQSSHVSPTLMSQNSQKVVNYTNTFALQEELKCLQQQSIKMTQEIQKLESEAERVQSVQLIKELEDKIKLLNQMNKQLLLDNTELMKVPNLLALRDLIVKYQNDRKVAYNQLAVLKNEIQNYRMRCEELEGKIKSDNSQELGDLVQELENKVQTLILENDRINLQLKNGSNLASSIQKQKHENDLVKEKLIKSRKEEEALKQSCQKDEIKLKLYEECNDKLKLLQDENKRLQQILNDSELNQNDLNSLQEKIQVIRSDNDRMMRQLKNKQ